MGKYFTGRQSLFGVVNENALDKVQSLRTYAGEVILEIYSLVAVEEDPFFLDEAMPLRP